MYKLLSFLVLATMLLFLSCQTAPEAVPPPAPEPGPTQTTEAPRPATPAPQTNVPAQAPVSLVNGLDMTGAQRYVVLDGDTLNDITRRFYGQLTGVGVAGTNNGFYYPILMMASPEANIADPDLIFPNMSLNIPDLRRNLANPASREAIRNFLRQVADIYDRKDIPVESEGLRRLANSL